MHSLYSSLQIKEPFPHFPKPKFFGRFEAEVIDQRKECALKLLEFIGSHDALFTSDIFVKFFESSVLDLKFLESSQSDTPDEDDTISCTRNPPKYIEKQSDIEFVKSNDNELSPELTSEVDSLSLKNENGSGVVIHDGSDLIRSFSDKAQYILIAAAHMSAAFRHEAIAEYEEAFTQYKLGISHLINGIQNEEDQIKKDMLQDKITKYLQRAERLYNRHLNCNVSVLHKPVSELRNYKVIKLMDSLMLVRDTLQGFQRVIKVN